MRRAFFKLSPRSVPSRVVASRAAGWGCTSVKSSHIYSGHRSLLRASTARVVPSRLRFQQMEPRLEKGGAVTMQQSSEQVWKPNISWRAYPHEAGGESRVLA